MTDHAALPPLPKLPSSELCDLIEAYGRRCFDAGQKIYAARLVRAGARGALLDPIGSASSVNDYAEQDEQPRIYAAQDAVDAARYRWIRDTAKGAPANSEFWPGIELDLPSALHDEWGACALPIDDAIDAVIERTTTMETT